MKALTKRDLIQGIVQAWEEQFGPNPEKPKSRAVLERLRELDLAIASEEDLEEIIGNRSWTQLKCAECKEDCESVVQIGDEFDPAGNTAYLCPSCLEQLRREFLIEEPSEFDTALSFS